MISDKSIESLHTTNLFNKNSESNANGFYNRGTWTETASYLTTHPISVNEGDLILCSKFVRDVGTTTLGVFIDNNDNVISILNNTFINNYPDDLSLSGYWYFIVPKGVKAVKLCMLANKKNSFMVVKNAEFPNIYIPYNETYILPNYKAYTSKYAEQIDLEYITSVVNPYILLENKKIAYNGDSITQSRFSGLSDNGGAYPYLISQITNGTYENYAVGGGTLAESQTSNYVICDHVDNMTNDADIIIFSGGINDYWKNIPLGTFSESDFTSTPDKTTVTGALESIFRQAINKWLGKPILFVITHKITDTAWVNNNAGYSFKDLHDRIVAVCEKYSIPYYDAFLHGGLNAYISSMNNEFLDAGNSGLPDGCHPNKEGYLRYYVPQVIKLISENLPVTINE
jgi:lysophospholipase L1-like esterase